MINDESIAKTETNSKDICFKCEAYCCKFGGVIATKNEVDAIIARGYTNHFFLLSDDVYGIDWGDDGTCVYLEDDVCVIYPVRPLGCRMFPVVQTRSNEIILIECPVSSHLSEEELIKRKRILKQRPMYIVRGAENLREEHIKELQIRASKYGHQKLS